MAETKAPNTNAEQLITEHLDIWTTSIEQKLSSGRGSSKKFSLHGIKKLRELILELAVRGKLVPQDPTDEPASVLLERIAAKKAQLIKDKKIKKPKAQPEISEDEKPFELPKGWEWARLENTGIGSTGKTPSTRNPDYFNGDIPFIGPGQITTTGTILQADKFLSIDGLSNSSEAGIGDIFMVCIGGSIGKAALVVERVGFNQQINCISPIHMASEYLYLALSSPNFYKAILEKATGSATPIINRGKWEELLVPTPPLEEQSRIAVKVDELMSLCDALEAQTENSITAHQTLVEVLLEALLRAPEQTATPEQATAQFQQNWQRLSEHFDTLFSTIASIDTLKQTILQLAVMGKLVPQNPNDEPAEELLNYLTENKVPKVECFNAELPKKWALCSIEHLISHTKKGMITGPFGSALKKSEHQDNGVPVWGIESIRKGKFTFNNKIYVTENKAKELSSFNAKSGDLIISRSGTIDEICVIPDCVEDGLISTNLLRISLNKELMMPEFFCFTFKGCDFVLKKIEELCAGTTRLFLNQKILKSLAFPMPPINEQKQIVAKVDELITLCDQLKARLTDAQSTKLHLTDAIVEQAL